MSRTKNDERPAAGRREVVYFAVYCVSSREAKQSRVCGIDQLRFAAADDDRQPILSTIVTIATVQLDPTRRPALIVRRFIQLNPLSDRWPRLPRKARRQGHP